MARSRGYGKFYFLTVCPVEENPIPELGAASRAEDHGGQGAPGLMGIMYPEGGVNPEGGVSRDGSVIHEGGGGNQEPEEQQWPWEEPAQAAMEDLQPENWEPPTQRRKFKFTPLQVQELENIFEFTQYPDVFLRRELAHAIGVSEEKVRIWFKNKRARYRQQQRQLMLVNEPPPEPSSDPDDSLCIVLD
uniref:Rhox homeobox family member 1 n=1 Tax=Saimiri boliviensis boliviensis TaxID=39432 RepID=A0A2K6V2V7_SAIBB